MSHLPRFHANGDPVFHGSGAFGPVVLTNSDPKFPPQQVQSPAPAPSSQHPPTRSVAAARQMPPPSSIPRSEYTSRRLVAQLMALSSPPAAVLPLPASAFSAAHRPVPFAFAISDMKTGHRWRASSPSEIVRADQVARPCADATDAWHNTSAMLYYPRREPFNTEVPITITFAPTHGPGLVGVAMTELARGRGVLEPETPIGNFFLSGYDWSPATGRLIFEWPGYNMLTFPLLLRDHKCRSFPRVAFGIQIARALHVIIEKFGDPNEFTPATGHMPLGRHGIRYERLRLLEAISFNGKDFYLRLSIVPPLATTA